MPAWRNRRTPPTRTSCFRSKRRTRQRHKFPIDISTLVVFRQKKREFLTKLFLVPFHVDSAVFVCSAVSCCFFSPSLVQLRAAAFSLRFFREKLKTISMKKAKTGFALFQYFFSSRRLKLRAKKIPTNRIGKAMREFILVDDSMGEPRTRLHWVHQICGKLAAGSSDSLSATRRASAVQPFGLRPMQSNDLWLWNL